MKIRVIRTYEIDWPGTPHQLVRFTNEELRIRHDTELDSLDLGDASYALTELYDQGDCTAYVDIDNISIEYPEGKPPSDAVLQLEFEGLEPLYTYRPGFGPGQPGADYTKPVHPYAGLCLDCGQPLTEDNGHLIDNTGSSTCGQSPDSGLHKAGPR